MQGRRPQFFGLLYFTPTTSTFLQADAQSSTVLLCPIHLPIGNYSVVSGHKIVYVFQTGWYGMDDGDDLSLRIPLHLDGDVRFRHRAVRGFLCEWIQASFQDQSEFCRIKLNMHIFISILLYDFQALQFHRRL